MRARVRMVPAYRPPRQTGPNGRGAGASRHGDWVQGKAGVARRPCIGKGADRLVEGFMDDQCAKPGCTLERVAGRRHCHHFWT